MGKSKRKFFKMPLNFIGDRADFGSGPDKYFPRIFQNVMYILKINVEGWHVLSFFL